MFSIIELPKYNSIVIYGAGGVAGDMIGLLKSLDVKPEISVAVSDTGSNPDSVNGILVHQIDEFFDQRDDCTVIIATMPVIAGSISSDLKNKGFGHLVTADEVIRELYDGIWQEPVAGNKVIFSNFGGKGYGGNCKYIAKELIKRKKEDNVDIDLVWIVNNPDMYMPDGIRKVVYGSYEHYFELGTARVWIDNQHKSFFSRKREGQCYIQTWHGVGPIKKIEYDAEGLSASYLELCDLNSFMEDIFISASGFNSEQCRRAFHYQGDILECGYPRNDILITGMPDEDVVRKNLGVPEGKKVVLYAPTFREGSRVLRPDLNRLCVALERRFGDEYVALVRLHPNDRRTDNIESGERIIDVTDYDDVQELLCVSDVLVTDYSSLMWDFSLQRKPVFLYHPDDRRYQEERGNYLPFSKMPYIEVINDDDLEYRIAGFDEVAYLERLGAFFKKYISFDNGNAAEAVADVIMGKII